MSDDVSAGDYGHVVPGEWQGVFAGSEEREYRIYERQGECRENQADDDVQGYFVAENFVGDVIILLAEEHRDHRGCSDSHEGSESG